MLPDENGSSSRFKEILDQLTSVYRYHLLIGLGAIFIIGIVILLLKGGMGDIGGEGKVEILGASESGQIKGQQTQELVVEISGEVKEPGVYTLPLGSRIDDLIQKGGGVTEDADIVWIAKALNKAAKLVDGQKLYIPKTKEVSSPQTFTENPSNYQSNAASAGVSTPENTETISRTIISSPQSGLVNINAATPKELDTLPGIGSVYAQKIIDHRPYSDINELSSRKVVPRATFEKIKDKISVF